MYHFTDERNIPFIKENGGLYSWELLDELGVIIPTPGGDSLSKRLDLRNNLQDYVRLNFTSNHPMLYAAKKSGRIGKSVLIKVDLDVLYWHDTLFSDRNATDKSALIGSHFSGLGKVNFGLINIDYWDGDIRSSICRPKY